MLLSSAVALGSTVGLTQTLCLRNTVLMPINELLRLIRDQPSPEIAWQRMLELFTAHKSSNLWSALPRPDFAVDKTKMRDWLQGNLARLAEPSGIYLGLDTLNMNAGAGTNIEIGWLPCDTLRNDTDWLYGDLQRGSSTLISGLYTLQATYSRPEWRSIFPFADYVVFLGYSGLVLREALSDFSASQPLLVAWGFHDGDMFILARTGAGSIKLICQ